VQYSEIVGIDKHFKSAYDITSDIGEAWKSFISNERFENNLNQIINVFNSPNINNRNSIWIQGTYGTGKSHSISVIKHLLCDDYSNIEDYLLKINRAQVRNNVSNFRINKKVYTVVLKGIYSITDVADLTYTIQHEIASTLKKDGINIDSKTDFESILQILKSGNFDSFFDHLLKTNMELSSYAKDKNQLIKSIEDNDIKVLRIIIDGLKNAGVGGHRTHNIIEWLKDIKNELVSKNIADYLMIMWDEFTSLLDVPERRSILNVIQDIAELSKKETTIGETEGIYLLLVTHKKLEATQSFKDLKEDERNMAKARFIELDYGMQPSTTYHILSGALIRYDREVLDMLINNNIRQDASVSNIVDKIVESSAANVNGLRDKIISLYPFHPYTSYLATFVSRVVGEAERSIFGFLNDEKLGFKNFITKNIEDVKFLTADYVWDFFFKTFDSNNSIVHFDAITNKFKLSYENVSQMGKQYSSIFKVILLLNILYRVSTTDADSSEKSMVNPSEENIVAAFTGIFARQEVISVLNYFDESQILHRSPDGVFELSTSSLPQKKIQEEKQKLYPSYEDVSKVLESYNFSGIGDLTKNLSIAISRENEVKCFWGGEKEYTLRNKLLTKFKILYTAHIALVVFRGETNELDRIINRKESIKYDAIKMITELSKEDQFSNIIFIVADTELGNKRYEAFIDNKAQENVARSLSLEEERHEGEETAEKWIKQWVRDIKTGYVDVIFKGDNIHIPFLNVSNKLRDNYIPSIFKAGLDYYNVPYTAWTKQNCKSIVEKVLYASNKADLESSLKGTDSAIKYLLSYNGTSLFDESLTLISDDENIPIVKVISEIICKLEKLKNETSIDLGKEFSYLTKPIYGYYQNRISMGALSLAFRPFIGKLYKSGNGQKVDKIVMKDIIVAIFDYWDNGKNKDDLIVRLSTEEERDLINQLNLIFELDDKDGLIETKWAIRDKFKNKNKAPLWALKFASTNSVSYNNFIDGLFKFTKSTDENIQQQFINELLDGIKTYKVELFTALSSIESNKCLKNYIAQLLSEVGGSESEIDEVIKHLEGVMSREVAFWEEIDLKNNVFKWKAQKSALVKSDVQEVDSGYILSSLNSSSIQRTSNVSPVIIPASNTNNATNMINKQDVIKKLDIIKYDSEKLYNILLNVLDKYNIVDYLNKVI
jgi:hypothetical protein